MSGARWRGDDHRNARLYAARLAEHGLSPQTLDWGSAESQRLRFAVLAEVAPLDGARVLDVGCGLGDFLGWLRERGMRVDYVGIDVTPALVEAARARFPDARFECASVLDGPLPEADFGFASGLFAHRRVAPLAFLKETVGALFASCRRAVSFNSLSAWAPQTVAGEFHADPARVLSFCRRLTPWVTLRHDYHPRDFTVYLYRHV